MLSHSVDSFFAAKDSKLCKLQVTTTTITATAAAVSVAVKFNKNRLNISKWTEIDKIQMKWYARILHRMKKKLWKRKMHQATASFIPFNKWIYYECKMNTDHFTFCLWCSRQCLTHFYALFLCISYLILFLLFFDMIEPRNIEPVNCFLLIAINIIKHVQSISYTLTHILG